ncbi:MAG: histidine phosphatase family protein [Leptolyngbya sp. IPPAS B-1204]
MGSNKIKIWVGVGVYSLLGAVPAAVASSDSPSGHAQPPQAEILVEQRLAQGGEGGEGGEGATPTFQDRLTGADLVNALRQGGYVIYFRHAQTEKDYADQVSATMGDCSTQRMLSEVGWQQARTIGKAFQNLQIPVGQVYSSEYCRAWQTADLAFGRYEKRAALNFPPAEEYTEEQVQQMRAAVMPMLTALPASGTNTVIVGHDDVFEAATGIYPEPQGVAYVVKPNGQGGFELVANLLPEEWAQLSQ